MKRLSGVDRRRQIIEAAQAVILQKGLAQAATRDVTGRLGVGSGLLHHYFKSWPILRAEAVRQAVLDEIEQFETVLAATKAADRVDRLVDWMADDGDMRHWSLWLNAVDEARRDPELRVVVHEAYAQWHAAMARALQGMLDAGIGRCPDPSAAAWRLCALIDGLAGTVLLGDGVMAMAAAKGLLRDQFALELDLDP
ncbi:MAG: TetR family transcriptional regulator C-terminal domain-containing protein [Pseudomonadota bacterium]